MSIKQIGGDPMARPQEPTKIEKLGLTEEVYRLRQTLSAKDTVKSLNAIYQDIKLSDSDVFRWEKRHNIQYVNNSIAVGVPLDTYQTVIDNYNTITTHVSRIENEMIKAKGDNNYPIPVDLLNSFSSAVEKKHKISLDMVKVEKEMMNTQNLKKITQAAIDSLKETNKELQQYIDEIVLEKHISIPRFDIMQVYQDKLQAYQNEVEEMKRK